MKERKRKKGKLHTFTRRRRRDRGDFVKQKEAVRGIFFFFSFLLFEHTKKEEEEEEEGHLNDFELEKSCYSFRLINTSVSLRQPNSSLSDFNSQKLVFLFFFFLFQKNLKKF